MNKQRINEELDKIDFPEQEVMNTIKNGIKKGKKDTERKKRVRVRKLAITSSIAASAFLASGLLFAPITNVLASVPIIGSIYDRFSMQIGYELFESKLVTQLNQTASSNAIDVTITSAYYDGNVIGLTFLAKGDRISLDKMEERGPEVGYSSYLFDGDEQKQWAGSMASLEKADDGYVGAMEFHNESADLPKNYTLPLTFTSITGVKGKWKFDIPVTQIPSQTIAAKEKIISAHETNYAIEIESVTKGKATTFLNYKTTKPADGENDEINITVFDNLGNRLSKSHAEVLATEQHNGVLLHDTRELFTSKISEDAQYLTIQPELRKDEQQTVSSLDQSAPFTVESSRFDYKIKVNSIEHDKNQIIIDYHVQNINSAELRDDIIQNFADFIMLIKSENIIEDDDGQLDMNHIISDQIRSTKTTAVDENYHFQSVFTLSNSNNTDIANYSLMVPFGTLSLNQPIEMDPVRFELK
ncbi:protein of unknown function [Terribacillus aidingensis]|uniref:DUF4179 domain-containing protein n=1 Tax=Terribacillus aidingensis TaxID=586416 RepID=A0A285N1G7_9BACI|nr:DUF4179 domain-containing protein [Terribacillus aidingensis]SNZ03178.1 protein of unknown function [Terribacillus aidingensis]